MKKLLQLSQALVLTTLLVRPILAEPDPGQISISVGRLLEQGHFTRQKLDDNMSRQLLKNFLEALDFNHLFFTQQDVEAFTAEYATTLDDEILLGNPQALFNIYKVYIKRVEDRVAKVKDQLKGEFDFSSNRAIELNRQKAPWPKDAAEADLLWKDRVAGEYLQEKLSEHPIETPVKILNRRYDQLLRNIHELTAEDQINTFLSTLAQTYDPHSEYFSKSELENFSINMRLSLVGIGAVLQSEDGYAKIKELVPGGPAKTEGTLKVNDRVTAVAQGDQEFVDTVGMKLDKVVGMIRGKKGTTVRLQVIPATATDPSQRKIIEIVRDEVKLKEQEAKAELIEKETPGGGPPQRLGWITLPSFYADMERSGEAGAKSTTRDVLTLLNRLKKENISGLVIDLRLNGGGSLEEAVNLTGLFIKRGPVVQVKDANGSVRVSKDNDPKVAYDGPLVVLTSRLSASASEIFAAALQDYGRAVVVGDQNTFGKGTVQTIVEIGRFMPFLGGNPNDAGALKLTIQKFYRVAGGSTQLKGVVSDIKLPSLWDREEFGEASLKGPLAYSDVAPANYERVRDINLPLKELRTRSMLRVAADPEFQLLAEDIERTKARIAANSITLNEQKRREEIAEDKARKERRAAEREKRKNLTLKEFQITLDNVDKPGLLPVSNEKKEEAPKGDADVEEDKPAVDAVRQEALNIVADMVELARIPRTASIVK